MLSWLWTNCPEGPAEVSDENKWNLIYQYRNELLSKCDWTQLQDADLTFDQCSAWQEYRQALRDLPIRYDNPDEVVLPAEPA